MTAISRLFPHLIAGFLALLYAQYISATMYVTTAVQFVSPAAVILVAHLAWLAATRRLQDGYSNVAFFRTAVTAAGLAAIIVLLAIIAPMPAEAAPGLAEVVYSILGVIGCLMMVAIVVGVPALIIYLAGFAIAKLYQRLRKGPPGGDSRLYDAGAVAVALLAIGTASLEGVPGAYSLAPAGQASSTYAISAPAARVWQAVGTATSPNFPLPAMLHSIPRPVAIVVDEGAALGARRVVRFSGREGGGDLSLRVVQRSAEEAVFKVDSDASPIANWVRHKTLTFRVEPEGSGSRLTVSLAYDRLLAPAWFFGPYVRAAAFLAVDVLARDTKHRAELP